MSGLKSSWEISLEKTNKMSPELKLKKKLTTKQKTEIAKIRKEYEVCIADKELMLDHKLKNIADRVPPEEILVESEKMKEVFARDKLKLKEEMESNIEAIRSL